MLTVFALIDLTAEVCLTWDEWRHPAVRAMTQHANDVVVWDNDLISYAKERDAVNGRNNLVSVLVTHAGCSVQEAMDRIGVMRDRAIARWWRWNRPRRRCAHRPSPPTSAGCSTGSAAASTTR